MGNGSSSKIPGIRVRSHKTSLDMTKVVLKDMKGLPDPSCSPERVIVLTLVIGLGND